MEACQRASHRPAWPDVPAIVSGWPGADERQSAVERLGEALAADRHVGHGTAMFTVGPSIRPSGFESFGFPEPAVLSGFGDAFDEGRADRGEAVFLRWLRPEEWAAGAFGAMRNVSSAMIPG